MTFDRESVKRAIAGSLRAQLDVWGRAALAAAPERVLDGIATSITAAVELALSRATAGAVVALTDDQLDIVVSAMDAELEAVRKIVTRAGAEAVPGHADLLEDVRAVLAVFEGELSRRINASVPAAADADGVAG